MPRALLALVLVFSLGNPAARSWMDALVQLVSDYGSQWDPNGAGAQSDYGGQWDLNG